MANSCNLRVRALAHIVTQCNFGRIRVHSRLLNCYRLAPSKTHRRARVSRSQATERRGALSLPQTNAHTHRVYLACEQSHCINPPKTTKTSGAQTQAKPSQEFELLRARFSSIVRQTGSLSSSGRRIIAKPTHLKNSTKPKPPASHSFAHRSGLHCCEPYQCSNNLLAQQIVPNRTERCAAATAANVNAKEVVLARLRPRRSIETFPRDCLALRSVRLTGSLREL